MFGPTKPERVKAALLDMIAAGGFADGRLPREEVLALELGVSRGTTRAALRSLEEQGLITRQRGRGTYVNQHVADSGPAINQIVSFYELIEQAGYQAGIAWTHVSRRPAAAGLDLRVRRPVLPGIHRPHGRRHRAGRH